MRRHHEFFACSLSLWGKLSQTRIGTVFLIVSSMHPRLPKQQRRLYMQALGICKHLPCEQRQGLFIRSGTHSTVQSSVLGHKVPHHRARGKD